MIGITGSTGNSTRSHLHLECSRGTAWNCQTFVSPGDILGFGNTRGTVIVYEGTPDALDEINQMAQNGVTIWHNHGNIGDYSVNNPIRS